MDPSTTYAVIQFWQQMGAGAEIHSQVLCRSKLEVSIKSLPSETGELCRRRDGNP